MILYCIALLTSMTSDKYIASSLKKLCGNKCSFPTPQQKAFIHFHCLHSSISQLITDNLSEREEQKQYVYAVDKKVQYHSWIVGLASVGEYSYQEWNMSYNLSHPHSFTYLMFQTNTIAKPTELQHHHFLFKRYVTISGIWLYQT